MKPRIVDLVSY